MNKYTICIILHLLSFNIFAQDVDFSQFKIEKNDIKGKLICINETHNVPTNSLAYYLIIKEVVKKFTDSDTLNIFIERSYSTSLMFNDVLRSKSISQKVKLPDFSQNKLHTDAWFDSLRSLKKNIRFIGADFEYDEGNRAKSYKYFFENLKDELARENLSVQELDKYIQKIDAKSIKNKDIEELKVSLKSIPLRTKSIADALFILEAKHQFFGYRDRNNFGRFVQIIDKNFDVKNQYNLMIYGSAHINPSNSKNLFNFFGKDKDSPFLANTLLIANYYFDCTAYGWYGSNEPSKYSGGLYNSGKGDETIITELKKKDWKSKLFVVKNELMLPLQSFNKILYFVVHKE